LHERDRKAARGPVETHELGDVRTSTQSQWGHGLANVNPLFGRDRIASSHVFELLPCFCERKPNAYFARSGNDARSGFAYFCGRWHHRRYKVIPNVTDRRRLIRSLGYTGNALSLKIIIAFLIGLALYNSIELIVLILVTFNKYHGLYFWSLVIAGLGVMPYSLGFLIKLVKFLQALHMRHLLTSYTDI
jgi:hypothetical protein